MRRYECCQALLLILLMIIAFASPGLAQAPTSDSDSDSIAAAEPEEEESDESEAETADELEADREAEFGNMEEIVIEGSRTQGLKEVPISVTQFGASDIENLRIQNVADLSDYVPNLEINTAFAASSPTLFIRGVGLKDYNSNSSGAVGIFHDGIMMNSPTSQLFSLYDIESIEVLRGPIGGLGGRNSTAGAIRIHSVKPTPEFTGDGSFTFGNLNEIAFEGAVGFPIFPDTFGEMFSGRVSFITEFRDGYTKNVCAGWDPEEHGLLNASEEGIRSLYNQLEPSQERVPVFRDNDPNSRIFDEFIYANPEGVAVLNNNQALTGQTVPFSRKAFLIGPDDANGNPTVGGEVAVQQDLLLVPSDRVCLLKRAGDVVTPFGSQSREDAKNGLGKPRDADANRIARGLEPLPSLAANEYQPDPNPPFQDLAGFQDLQSRYNDIKYWATRAQLLFQPTDNLDFLASFHWGQNRGDSFHLQTLTAENVEIKDDGSIITESLGYLERPNGNDWSEIRGTYAPFEGRTDRDHLGPPAGDTTGLSSGRGGDDPYSGFYNSDGKEILDLLGGSLTANYEFDWGRVRYIGGYEENTRTIEDEGDNCPCTPLEAILDDEVFQITQDLSVEFEGDGYFVKLGGFFIHEELVTSNQFNSNRSFEFIQVSNQDTDAWNIGGDFHYDFFEEDLLPGLFQISADGGIRYNWERKGFTLVTSSTSKQTGAGSMPLDGAESAIWKAVTGEFTLSYKPLENLRLYAKYTRGFKAGHFNAGLTIQPVAPVPGQQTQDTAGQSLTAVAPEYIDAIEIGLKSNWFDDKIELSGAVFRYFYQDLQIFDIVNEPDAIPTNQLLNSDADVLGAEIELKLRPIEGLFFVGGFGWLDSEFLDFFVTKTIVPPRARPPGPPQVATFDYSGNPLIAAPRFSGSGYVEYEVPLSRYGSLVPAFDFSYKSKTYLDPQKADLISQDGYWLFNARLTYRTPGGSIEVSGWVQNFLNEVYKNDVFDETRGFSHILEIYSEPRTYGMTVSYSW